MTAFSVFLFVLKLTVIFNVFLFQPSRLLQYKCYECHLYVGLWQWGAPYR